MKRYAMTREEIIKKIIRYEWEMFQKVNEGGFRAPCQESPETFTAMRMAQYTPWSDDALMAWLQDLALAGISDVNLVEQKYIRMMESTEPERFEELSYLLLPVSQAVEQLAQTLSETLLAQDVALTAEYPLLTGRGRPSTAEGDTHLDTSIETYQTGEFLTYSVNTLNLLLKQVKELEKQRKSFVEEILKATVQIYGYETLDEAETALERIQSLAGL